MTNPNPPHPPTPVPVPEQEQLDEVAQQYAKSADILKKVLIALEFCGVAFTLPHNLSAFGIEFNVFTWSIFIAILGVATIEGAWVYSMSHFTHGWISSKRQRNMAIAAWFALTAVLIGNAIVAELSYLVTSPEVVAAQSLVDSLVIYKGYFLPSTPIIALVLVGLLLSMHPKTVATGRAFAHLAATARKEQEAQLALLDAKNEIKLQDIKAKRQEHAADITKREIEANARIAKVQADAQETAQNQQFAFDARKAVFTEKEAQLKAELDSEEFKTEIRETVQAEIKRIIRDQKKEALAALKKD